jgi:hypothetical protein
LKVVRWGDRARVLRLQVPGGEISTIECHDHCLTIEDEDVAPEIIGLLESPFDANKEAHRAVQGVASAG